MDESLPNNIWDSMETLTYSLANWWAFHGLINENLIMISVDLES